MLKSYPPASQNVTLFGNRVVAGVISQGKMKSYWSRVGPYSNVTGVLIRRGKFRRRDRDT